MRFVLEVFSSFLFFIYFVDIPINAADEVSYIFFLVSQSYLTVCFLPRFVLATASVNESLRYEVVPRSLVFVFIVDSTVYFVV